MNKGPDFNGESNVDHNDKHDTIWTESKARAFLAKTDAQIEKFLKLYKNLREIPQRLDTVAQYMDWEENEWKTSAIISIEESDNDEDDESNEDEILDISIFASSAIEPYTFYQYPQYIAIKGLLAYMMELLNHLPLNEKLFPLFSELSKCHSKIDLSFASFDLNEDMMVICQLKEVLLSINHLLDFFQHNYFEGHRVSISVQKEILSVLFDIREIILRFLKGFREELEEA